MQTVLVILTFGIAVGYLLRKFIWTPITQKQLKASSSLDGQKTKCGNHDCGCH